MLNLPHLDMNMFIRWMQRLARWNDEYLNPILQRNPDTGHDAR